MKLHLSRYTGNSIRAYGSGFVTIGEKRFETNLALGAETILESWAVDGFDALTAADFERLLEIQPEVVLLGTGERQRFPAPVLLRPLIEARIGCEVMDTGAACRTFNILAAEGRRVAAGLLLR